MEKIQVLNDGADEEDFNGLTIGKISTKSVWKS